MAKKTNWIKKVSEGIKKRGTEGKCSGKNFGSPKCPKGSRAYNLAVNFRKMNKKK